MVRLKSATGGIAVVTVAVSALAILLGVDQSALFAGFIPARLSGMVALPGALPAWLTPLSSMLIHGGWLHLAVNMVVLALVGPMVERVVGWSGLLVAYLAGGLVAALAQYLVDPAGLVPMVGASGALSALIGLYAVFFGQPKQVTRNQRINRWVHVVWLLAAWVVLQWMTGLLAEAQGVMLATAAHVGGFAAGLLLHRPLLLWRYRKA